ncbi:MAG TPA: TetR/AcrR family transcriptional regulator [Solirubrobacterales bacterium]|nr:TetR/AcrR family transcriptional regulator [Solirubrobacterales bacterium]
MAQRQRIVDALIESCAEKTYSATTITDIVGRAHISRTTFYKRFRDKRACFDAAVDYCIEELCEAALAAQEPEDAPGDAIRKGATAVLEAMAARPSLAQLLTGDAVSVDPAVIDRYRSLVTAAVGKLWTTGRKKPKAGTDPKVAFGRAQLLILNEIAAGRSDRLPDLAPQIVYLAVAPFGGHEEAVRQSQLVEPASAASRRRDGRV